MKHLIQNLRIHITRWYKKETPVQAPYLNLGPINNADRDHTYTDAILWALNNENIYNIAISGADGSGKSSVLKTFFNIYKNHYKYINISLANFYAIDEVEKESEQVIEKSILQQLFYSVSSDEIPFSRFRRINKVSRIKLWFRVLIVIECFYIGYLFYNPTSYTDIVNMFEKNHLNVSYISLLMIIFTVSISYLIHLAIFYLIKGFRLTKISFNNNQIEIEKDAEESIFNKYIDEIIYFFEETGYNVVVFEDLDRFRSSTKVFVKIRELNRLLNSTRISKNRVVFIYAVRDDLFENRMEKTKFFDFIIPIVPINTFMNIPSELKKLFQDYGLYKMSNCSDEFLNDMASFILDRRTLINIMNEFYIYIMEYNKSPLKNFYKQLFVLIVYKNVKPAEFSKMIFNNGIINKLFINKQNKINYEKDRIEKLIKEMKISDNDSVQIEELIDEIGCIERMSLSKIIRKYGVDGLTLNDKNDEDEIYFIKKGYIDESYMFYLSYFAEGILSKNDMTFYLSVKNQENGIFGYWDLKLTNIKYLIMMFNENDFKTNFIYNYYLISFLLKNSSYYSYQLNVLGECVSRYFSQDSNLFYILYRAFDKEEDLYALICQFLIEKMGIDMEDIEHLINEYEKDIDEDIGIFITK